MSFGYWKILIILGIAEFTMGIITVAVFHEPIYIGAINVTLGAGLLWIGIEEYKKSQGVVKVD